MMVVMIYFGLVLLLQYWTWVQRLIGLENGTKVFSKWENLVSCTSWSHWDIFEARRPASELVEGDSNVWAFHSCNFKDGKGVSDLRANDMIWNILMVVITQEEFGDGGLEAGPTPKTHLTIM